MKNETLLKILKGETIKTDLPTIGDLLESEHAFCISPSGQVIEINYFKDTLQPDSLPAYYVCNVTESIKLDNYGDDEAEKILSSYDELYEFYQAN